MKLIGPLVLLALVSLAEGEVVTSFVNICPGFFVEDQNNRPITPTLLIGGQYELICQRYQNSYRYATLYDTSRRIPVYSAYKHIGYQKTTPRTWMIEPQLDVKNGGTEMTTDGQAGGQVGGRQAVNADYERSTYDRGHLYPRCNNCIQDQEESTFTLTNAAPQKNADNRNWYQQVEKQQQNIQNNCDQNIAYVVTGVIPGNNFISNGRVNIPSHYWSAYCCKQAAGTAYISEGYMLEMDGLGKAVATNPTLAQLNNALSGVHGPQFQVFGTIKGCS